MKKIVFVALLFLIFFASCRRGKIQINDYGYYVKNCHLPFNVDFFVDLDYVGKKIEFVWDFGDGTTSEQQNPSHTYTKNGVYNVQLLIKNYKAEEVITFTLDLSADTINPKADFDFYSPYGNFYQPAVVQFVNHSQFSSSFFWNFGDGYASSVFEPKHIYDTANIFSVKLTASCENRSDQITKQIQILPPPNKIIIDRVDIWLPDDLLGRSYKLRYYLSIFEQTPILLSERYADYNPITWYINEPLEDFDGIYDDRELYFEVYDQEDWTQPIFSFGLYLSDLQAEHYPDTLYWDQGEFRAQVILDYAVN